MSQIQQTEDKEDIEIFSHIHKHTHTHKHIHLPFDVPSLQYIVFYTTDHIHQYRE